MKIKRAEAAPTPVPMVPPIAPNARERASFFPCRTAHFIRKKAAPTLTPAFRICSTIWEIAVGTMVDCPCQYPRHTPR